MALQELDLLLFIVLLHSLFFKVTDLLTWLAQFPSTPFEIVFMAMAMSLMSMDKLTQLLIQSFSNSPDSLPHLASATFGSLRGSRISCLSRHAKYLSRESQHSVRADFLVRSGVGSVGGVDDEKKPILTLLLLMMVVWRRLNFYLFFIRDLILIFIFIFISIAIFFSNVHTMNFTNGKAQRGNRRGRGRGNGRGNGHGGTWNRGNTSTRVTKVGLIEPNVSATTVMRQLDLAFRGDSSISSSTLQATQVFAFP